MKESRQTERAREGHAGTLALLAPGPQETDEEGYRAALDRTERATRQHFSELAASTWAGMSQAGR